MAVSAALSLVGAIAALGIPSRSRTTSSAKTSAPVLTAKR
jgi:hypothetical protein